ncbi:MAG: HAD family hydrolase [Lachnospiraceae bacterium]|nr:HAD family hydrolase [Lachnospiraceae bacterium]
MHLYDHKAVVWDLDGTLYYQRDMRIKMALSLVSYYLIRPHRIKELLAVKQFRQIRESWKDEENTGDALKKAADGMMKGCVGLDELSALQYARTAMDLKMKPEAVKAAVDMWIYERPLEIIYSCRDEKAADLIGELSKKGIESYIFSDYPVEDKLKALKIQGIKGSYAATDERVGVLKPDPKGLNLLMEDHGYEPGDLIMIGDRMSRDGEAAKRAGCEFYILSKSRIKRRKDYRILTGR